MVVLMYMVIVALVVQASATLSSISATVLLIDPTDWLECSSSSAYKLLVLCSAQHHATKRHSQLSMMSSVKTTSVSLPARQAEVWVSRLQPTVVAYLSCDLVRTKLPAAVLPRWPCDKLCTQNA